MTIRNEPISIESIVLRALIAACALTPVPKRLVREWRDRDGRIGAYGDISYVEEYGPDPRAVYARARFHTAIADQRPDVLHWAPLTALALILIAGCSAPNFTAPGGTAYALIWTATLSGDCGTLAPLSAHIGDMGSQIGGALGACRVEHEPCDDQYSGYACNAHAATWLCYHDAPNRPDGIDGVATIGFDDGCLGSYSFEGQRE